MTSIDPSDEGAADQPRAPKLLDPFTYFPDVASKIAGLGGATSRPELEYGFHTHYDWCVPGPCMFTVRMNGLTASYGILALQVNMLSVAPGSHAKIATIERVQLADLVAASGTISIAFESLRGQIYALYGLIAGDTDARAAGLTVEIDRPGSEHQMLDPDRDVSPSSFGTSAVDQIERLASSTPAVFATPVSQPYSPAQTVERAYVRWAKALAEPVARDRKQWERLYVLQALDQYGMLRHGAVGRYLDDEPATIVEQLELRGCAVTTTDLLEPGCSVGATFLDRPGVHADFVWTRSLGNMYSSVSDAILGAEALMAQLRPGGIGIHIFPFIRDATSAQAWHNGPRALSRVVVERFALNLISRGYELAQLKFELGAHPIGISRAGFELASFGVIARRQLLHR